MLKKYLLDENNNLVICEDHTEWVLRFNSINRYVDLTEKDNIVVSTVFLGMDHGFSISQPNQPILFETMVFGDMHDTKVRRYSTWGEAVKGHREMCELVFGYKTCGYKRMLRLKRTG